jgi:hypothetical protein
MHPVACDTCGHVVAVLIFRCAAELRGDEHVNGGGRRTDIQFGWWRCRPFRELGGS